jgi:hypothetical protein
MEFESPPPCAKSPALFDSDDQFTHLECRSICMNECDRVDWCVQQLAKARAKELSGPDGTWAGLFMAKGVRGRPSGPIVVVTGRSRGACGTPRGHRIHTRMGEPSCDACKASLVLAKLGGLKK